MEKNYVTQKILGFSYLEILFLKQMEELEKLSFSQKILDTLIAKKDVVLKAVSNKPLQEGVVPFLPAIPVKMMDSTGQLKYHNGWRFADSMEIYAQFNGFLYNEERMWNLVNAAEPYFLVNVSVCPLEEVPVPAQGKSQNDIGYVAREFFKNKGLHTLNHVEALSVACHSKLMPADKNLCAFSCDWDGFEFAAVYHSFDARGNGLCNTSFSIQNGFLKKRARNHKDILVPVCEKRV